jgi:predicted CopG family antitoxin
METQAITVRLPKDVYEQLRREAFDTRESMASIIISALEKRLAEPKDSQQ